MDKVHYYGLFFDVTPNFGHPVLTKEINDAAWPFLGEYSVTKVEVLKLKITVHIIKLNI